MPLNREARCPFIGTATAVKRWSALEADWWKNTTEGIKELVEAFDFDSADAAITELYESYKIPDSYKELLDKIKVMLSAVNRDGILKILQNQQNINIYCSKYDRI